jgi:hypothetical protein
MGKCVGRFWLFFKPSFGGRCSLAKCKKPAKRRVQAQWMTRIRPKQNKGLTLTRLKTGIGFVNNINLATATHNLAIFVPRLGRFQRR